MRGGSNLRKAYRAVAALAVAVVVIAAVTIGLRATYGYFSNDIKVSGVFPRASQALKKGSDVKYLGVSVGKVRRIQLLPNHNVRISLTLSRNAKIPSNVKAVISPNTFFGDKFVDLVVQNGRRTAPWLTNGSTLASTSSGEEVEQLISEADNLIGGINSDDLTSLITELTRFSRGEGTKIAENLDVGVKAASSFAATIDAQVNALDALARFQSSIKNLGPDINSISGDLNTALPTFNAARHAFYQALDTLKPFADNLASLIAVNRPSLDRILVDGEDVARVILAQHDNIGQTVYGLYRYALKFGTGGSADTLPDGTKFAYFKQIADFRDIATLVCGLVGPAQPAFPPELTALQQQLVGLLSTVSSGRIDCSAYTNPRPTIPAGQQAATAPTTAGAPAAPSITEKIYGALATPDQSKPGSLATFLSQLLGGPQ